MPLCTVIPVLPYTDVGQAVDWLCRAFGFNLRLRIANHRAQLNVGGGAVVITEGSASHESGEVSVMVRVENVDAHCSHAKECGAQILSEPTSHPYGERQYTAKDPSGMTWTFSQTVADIDPVAWGGEAGLLS